MNYPRVEKTQLHVQWGIEKHEHTKTREQKTESYTCNGDFTILALKIMSLMTLNNDS